MALPSTLHHFDLHLAHADTGLSAEVTLKAARHPSETIERLWLRVLAYGWRYREGIALGPGLCDADAPDVLARGLDGRTTLVVRVGKPEPQRVLRDVTGNAGAEVAVLFESPRRMEAFVAEARAGGLERLSAVALGAPPPALVAALGERDERRVRVGLTFVTDHVYVDLPGGTLEGALERATW